MNGLQIMRKLSEFPGTRDVFKGVYSCDLMPRGEPPFLFICNTSTHEEAGEHWVAFYVYRNGHDETVEIFDSFGRSYLEFEEPTRGFFVNYVGNRICVYQTRQLEGFLSTSCGQFCCYYVALRAAGLPYKEIVKSLSDDLYLNDIAVKNL